MFVGPQAYEEHRCSGLGLAPRRANPDRTDFDRRCARIVAGEVLASTRNLISGCPALKEDVFADAQAFASVVLDRMPMAFLDDPLIPVLTKMLNQPGIADFEAAARAFQSFGADRTSDLALSSVGGTRCWFYAATLGNRAGLSNIAGYAAGMSHSSTVIRPPQLSGAEIARAWQRAATETVSVPEQWAASDALGFLLQGKANTFRNSRIS